jgi:hypothetical protein
LEFLLNESDGDQWLYRRDHRVSLPLAVAITTSPKGVPHLAPEVVILYKSKRRTPKDEADLTRLLPTLSPEARSWLADAVALADPANPWLSRL